VVKWEDGGGLPVCVYGERRYAGGGKARKLGSQTWTPPSPPASTPHLLAFSVNSSSTSSVVNLNLPATQHCDIFS
jgi:hypothetical protein